MLFLCHCRVLLAARACCQGLTLVMSAQPKVRRKPFRASVSIDLHPEHYSRAARPIAPRLFRLGNWQMRSQLAFLRLVEAITR